MGLTQETKMSQYDQALLKSHADGVSEPAADKSIGKHSRALLGAAAVLGLWFALVFFLGAGGQFVRSPGTPPFPILIGVTLPVIVFFVILSASPAFRDFVLHLDLPLITAIQAWRFAGFGFLALYAHEILSGLFAWPAGIGDIAIGVTAPWIAFTLIRSPSFASSRSVILWNLVGILDLVVAVGTGALSSVLAAGTPSEVTTAPMAQLPLVLIPAYFVPLFVMLRAAALLQARRPTVLEHLRERSKQAGALAASHGV